MKALRSPVLLTFYTGMILFLGLFLIYPVFGVFGKTFFFTGSFSPGLFFATISGPTVTGALRNSFLLAGAAVILTTLLSLPLAIVSSGYTFPGKRFTAGLVLLPMIMPPFVGAIGIQRLFARYGMINMLFGTAPFDWLGAGGFWGVAALQALHLFPIMYLNVSASLSNINPQLSEAARSCGSSPWRVFFDITIPLALPGFTSGALLVFLWSLTDLGTPLVLGFRRVLAVEIFDRTSAINTDPTGPAMVVFIILLTLAIMFVFKKCFDDSTTVSASKGYVVRQERPLSRRGGILLGAYLFVLVGFSLLPHFGLLLTSVAEDWFATPFPAHYTLEHFGTALADQGVGLSVRNSLMLSSLSTLIDVSLGLIIAWFVIRKRVAAAWLIDAFVMLPIALPGLILAFGYVASYSGTILDPLRNPVPLLVIGYSVRRLPYCFRAACAGLQQVGVEFEEAARVCGASARRTILDITVPLIGANLLAGGILAFMFAMLEVSESMVLAVKREFFPITRQIYALLGKIPDGDYVASALGVVCMLFLAAGLVAASTLLGKQMGKMFRM